MLDRVKSRKEAYRYIVQRLSILHSEMTGSEWMQSLPLDELKQLKEGDADPSEALVDFLKGQFKGLVNDTEIDSHLVEPFDTH